MSWADIGKIVIGILATIAGGLMIKLIWSFITVKLQSATSISFPQVCDQRHKQIDAEITCIHEKQRAAAAEIGTVNVRMKAVELVQDEHRRRIDHGEENTEKLFKKLEEINGHIIVLLERSKRTREDFSRDSK